MSNDNRDFRNEVRENKRRIKVIFGVIGYLTFISLLIVKRMFTNSDGIVISLLDRINQFGSENNFYIVAATYFSGAVIGYPIIIIALFYFIAKTINPETRQYKKEESILFYIIFYVTIFSSFIGILGGYFANDVALYLNPYL